QNKDASYVLHAKEFQNLPYFPRLAAFPACWMHVWCRKRRVEPSSAFDSRRPCATCQVTKGAHVWARPKARRMCHLGGQVTFPFCYRNPGTTFRRWYAGPIGKVAPN